MKFIFYQLIRKFSLGKLTFIACILVFISCKKNIAFSELDKQAPPATDIFKSNLYQKLLHYDHAKQIIDSVSAFGILDWSKMAVRFSSNRQIPLNFDIPISTIGADCDHILELGFDANKNLDQVTLRQLDVNQLSASNNSNALTENERTANILYQISKQGLIVNPVLINFKKSRKLYSQNKMQKLGKIPVYQ